MSRSTLEVRLYRIGADGVMSRVGLTYLASGRYTLSKYEAGPFELVIPAGSEMSTRFVPDLIVLIDKVYWGVITGRRIDRGRIGSVTVVGSELKEWLSRRVIIPIEQETANVPIGYDSVSGSTESIIKSYVDRHVVSPTNWDRRMNGINIVMSQNRGIQDDAYAARYECLLDTIISIGKRANLGVTIFGDERTGEFYFDVIPRKDRTIHQTKNKPLIFDVARANAISTSYSEEYSQSANTFFCSRSGDRFAWETLTQTYFSESREPSGYARREKALAVSVYTESAQVDQYTELEKNARKEMTKYSPAKSLECILADNLEYAKDYALGDYVTTSDSAAGISADMEIVSVETNIEPSQRTTKIGFGEQVLSKYQKINRGGN